ncbi:DUF2889 domain-containing protein [Alloalcanivorax mobilis]|uniref:DUF2889 domain-containing protein n=1 Tax=Alloalcanivorax mobilis TaxID=2019569 RepID=UPI000C77F97C|nr:DUF2889 domain-containing protein [Alloalcanivorax mobilis]|tara:strand:- start:12403 stop:12972 length:570 start_codon:yes stop_codon:yes gene_type:complete
MPLPEPVERSCSHKRALQYQSYLRDDALWDIEARITDSKYFDYYDLTRGRLVPGDFIHDIAARVTINDVMDVTDIVYSMDAVPYRFCQGGGSNISRLIGANLSRGWRRSLNEALGGTCGCTHLKEMLFGVATVAFQTLSSHRENRSSESSMTTGDITERPFYIDSCYSMAVDSPVVRQFYPRFYEKGKQ